MCHHPGWVDNTRHAARTRLPASTWKQSQVARYVALRITYALQFHAALSPSSMLSWLLMRSCPSCRPPAATIDGRRPTGRLPSCRRAATASTTAYLAAQV
jgi:hypothetical protein